MNSTLDPRLISQFRATVWQHFIEQGRSLPWRERTDPYAIVVSELMLQQTQVSRVTPKFNLFMATWPSFEVLASATLAEVLQAWNGLGYNRRARYLHELAKTVVTQYGGKLPNTKAELIKLPGIGPGTAGAILAYAFNQPAVFIETNIRTVFIHHFFQGVDSVSDKEILPILEQTLPREEQHRSAKGGRGFTPRGAMRNPEGVSYREFYWAVMDYGAYLKAQGNRVARLSKHHTVQSRFKGSARQIRGQVIAQLVDQAHSLTELKQIINDSRLRTILQQLEQEGLIQRIGRLYQLPAQS